MVKITKEAALLYHSQGKPGKIEVVPTKPYSTQTDLSLAYSPGVAEPCLEIEIPSNLYSLRSDWRPHKWSTHLHPDSKKDGKSRFGYGLSQERYWI